MILPNIWKNKSCSKPPTSQIYRELAPQAVATAATFPSELPAGLSAGAGFKLKSWSLKDCGDKGYAPPSYGLVYRYFRYIISLYYIISIYHIIILYYIDIISLYYINISIYHIIISILYRYIISLYYINISIYHIIISILYRYIISLYYRYIIIQYYIYRSSSCLGSPTLTVEHLVKTLVLGEVRMSH